MKLSRKQKKISKFNNATLFILKNGRIRALDFLAKPKLARKWERCYKDERHVGNTKVGDAWISTVFLGVNYSFRGDHPVLFETIIFRNGSPEEMWRYTTVKKALKGHRFAVALVKAEGGSDGGITREV